MSNTQSITATSFDELTVLLTNTPVDAAPIATANKLCTLLSAAASVRAPISKSLQERIMLSCKALFETNELSIDEACQLYNHLYFMKWQATVKLSDLDGFNSEAVEPFSAYLLRHKDDLTIPGINTNLPTVPLRIAYLNGSNSMSSGDAIARVTMSAIRGHMELASDNTEIYVIATENPDDGYRKHLREIGAKIIDPPPGTFLDRAVWVVRKARQLGIHAIISDNNLALATLIFTGRAAPLQMFLEMGFPHWNIPELDYLLLGISPTADNPVPDRPAMRTGRALAMDFLAAPRSPSEIKAFRQRFEPWPVAAGFYGRLIKVSPEYLSMIGALLASDPTCAIYIGGVGDPATVETFIKGSPHRDRIYFDHGYVDGHIVGAALDIFLDSFPFQGGVSVLEVSAKGTPTVWIPNANEEPFYTPGFMRDPDLASANTEEYLENARKLIRDSDHRLLHGERAKSQALAASNCSAVAMELEGIIRKYLAPISTIDTR